MQIDMFPDDSTDMPREKDEKKVKGPKKGNVTTELYKSLEGSPKQSDMFQGEKNDILREKAEKKFKEQQKLDDKPLPKYHRAPSGGGGMKPDTDVTASKKLPKMAKGGAVGSASKRADGCAIRGKTRGKVM